MSKIAQFQARDALVVDYELFALPELDFMLRGPQPPSLAKGEFAAVLGTGYSFGVLVRDPFVHKLARAIRFPVLNLSIGGVAPCHYLDNPAYLDLVNRARFCIMQVMSARGSASSYFEADRGRNLLRPRGSALPYIPADVAYRRMIEIEPPITVAAVVGELRASWTADMTRLLSRIRVPKMLLWFAKRPPAYAETRGSFRGVAGVFPQFVQETMLESVREFADAYVEVVSTRGMPHVLTEGSTGAPVFAGHQSGLRSPETYYPSPEMHEDAFLRLLPAIYRVVAHCRTERRRTPASVAGEIAT